MIEEKLENVLAVCFVYLLPFTVIGLETLIALASNDKVHVFSIFWGVDILKDCEQLCSCISLTSA